MPQIRILIVIMVVGVFAFIAKVMLQEDAMADVRARQSGDPAAEFAAVAQALTAAAPAQGADELSFVLDGAAGDAATADAGTEEAMAAPADAAPEGFLATLLAKAKAFFGGSDEDTQVADAGYQPDPNLPTAERDLGRLGGHFKTAPQAKSKGGWSLFGN